MGEAKRGPLRVDFDRRLKLEFHGSEISSDAGLLSYLELDDALGLCALAGDVLSEIRPARTIEHGSLTKLREKLVRIDVKMVRHGRYVTFQMAVVAVSRRMFRQILSRITRLRAPPLPA